MKKDTKILIAIALLFLFLYYNQHQIPQDKSINMIVTFYDENGNEISTKDVVPSPVSNIPIFSSFAPLFATINTLGRANTTFVLAVNVTNTGSVPINVSLLSMTEKISSPNSQTYSNGTFPIGPGLSYPDSNGKWYYTGLAADVFNPGLCSSKIDRVNLKTPDAAYQNKADSPWVCSSPINLQNPGWANPIWIPPDISPSFERFKNSVATLQPNQSIIWSSKQPCSSDADCKHSCPSGVQTTYPIGAYFGSTYVVMYQTTCDWYGETCMIGYGQIGTFDCGYSSFGSCPVIYTCSSDECQWMAPYSPYTSGVLHNGQSINIIEQAGGWIHVIIYGPGGGGFCAMKNVNNGFYGSSYTLAPNVTVQGTYNIGNQTRTLVKSFSGDIIVS